MSEQDDKNTGGSQTIELEAEAEKEEESIGSSKLNPKRRGLLYHFLISFVAGLLASAIMVGAYARMIAPKLPQFYSFDLSSVIQQKEVEIMKNPNKNMKAEIAAYMDSLQKYINSYASHGIVLVTGASIGSSPYVKDITNGFIKNAPK
ncbi:MAG: hypothetical protein QXP36_14330 [Conexivisphaerales archaeon]